MPSTKRIRKRGEQARTGGVCGEQLAREHAIDLGRGRLRAIGDVDTRAERGRDRIAIASQTTGRTHMRALAEGLGGAGTAQTVLRERGGPRRGTHDTAVGGARELRDHAGLALERTDQRSRRERGHALAPPARPGAQVAILDDEAPAMVAHEPRRDLPRELATSLGSGLGVARVGGPVATIGHRQCVQTIRDQRRAVRALLARSRAPSSRAADRRPLADDCVPVAAMTARTDRDSARAAIDRGDGACAAGAWRAWPSRAAPRCRAERA